jgi:LytS/YehU family sensor histidine kinase
MSMGYANVPGTSYEYIIKNLTIGQLLSLSSLIVCFYVFYILILPGYIKTKKTFRYAIYSFLVLFFSACLCLITNDIVYFYNKEVILFQFLFAFIVALIIGFLGVTMKVVVLWIKSMAEKKALLKKHLESQTALLLLKAQLNPHFLFNSLNNIDILIKESPKIASDYLKKLSDILRYVLYETKEDVTSLTKEINQIKNYIELQKIRTDNMQFVDFAIKGEIREQKIVPMIFLPFIENAFKFSKNKAKEHAIEVVFEISDYFVNMYCKNYYERNKLEIVKSEGLGIETIKQRLILLYPEKHKLVIDQTEHWFNVSLHIDF